jgi:orotate phosphoribosyltransferase
MSELRRAGAVLLNQHFVYKSSRHGSGYINMDPIYTNPGVMADFADHLLLPFDGERFDTVVAPAVGGVALVTYVGVVGFHRYQHPIHIAWADKDGDEFHFDRTGFVEQLRGKRVLVVEDLLTTGGSVAKVCKETRAEGAQVIGISVICNRGGVTAEQLGVPRLEALAEVDFETFDPDACPLCSDRVPIVTDIGHGDVYQGSHPDYEGGYIKLLA